MKRLRLMGLAAAVVAVLVGSLGLASPAMADTFGPVKNYGNGLCFQPEGGSSAQGTLIVQEPCDLNPITLTSSNPFQQWRVSCLGSGCGVFRYVNVGSGLCLRARGLTGPANGEQIMLWTCNQISDLNWTQHSVDIPGRADLLGFTMESRISGSTGYCLDVPGASGAIGLALQLYRCNGTVAQLWDIQINVT
jgi:hypothetical protein